MVSCRKNRFDNVPDFPDEMNCFDDRSPIPDMVALDIQRAIELSRMTRFEGDVLYLYAVCGFSLREIAKLREKSYDTVRKQFWSAVKKAERVPYFGIITCIIETFGDEINQL